MVHIIPLFVGERRLDTGNAVQYPDSSPVGEAVQQFGDRWQAAAERYEQRKAQQQAFDTEIAARRLNGELARAEADAVANAPADGAGLHDTMYGQVDPYTGQVVKTGLFDTLFGNFLKQVPPELRPGLAARKEALREAGAIRMALQQNQRRKQYEQDQVAEVHTAELRNIAQSNPNDTAAFDASRRAGLDVIAKMDLDPRAKALAEADWRDRAAKERMQALIAQDPRRAAEMLSAGPVASDGMGETVRAQLGAGVRDEKAAVNGQKTPDETAQVFGERPSPGSDAAIPLDAITYLKPGDIAALKAQANNATAAQMIGANARVMLAEQSAPSVIAATGKYPEEDPTAQDFVQVYGADLGPERFKLFRINTGIGKAYSDMHAASNQAIRAELLHSRPRPGSSPEARDRYDIKVGAAKLIMAARAADPVAYASMVFRGDAPDWSKVKTPEELQAAVNWAAGAQQQLGFDKRLPLPWDFAARQAAEYIDPSKPFNERLAELSSLVLAVRDPGARRAMAKQISLLAEARWRAKAAQDPSITPELLEAQVGVLKKGLDWVGEHPAQARYSTMSWLRQPAVAFGDIGRTIAKGATAGGADSLIAGLATSVSGESYEQRLAREQAETEDAEDRAGSAGWVAEVLGAGLTGYGAAKGLFGLLGRAGAGAAAEGGGLTGLGTRTAVGAATGGLYGGIYAYNTDESIPEGVLTGAVGGAGLNVLAEGIGAVGRQVARRLGRRFGPAELPTSSETEEIVAGSSPPSRKFAHSTEGSPSEGADFQKGTEDLSKLGSDYPSGSFSISDWAGYSALVPKPKGPFRLPEGMEYDAARGAADKANRTFRRKQGLVGEPVDVHEIHPVKFGGSPTDPANKIVLPRDVHQQQVTPWWNQLLKDLGEKE
ncbi:conserved hypothetical protein [Mesorhizobium plurifarium]|uniref:Uncharacterized protein n=1 Tax=Mesorhizobium plurifarium TaxID=69974 RepID=A0A0K2VYL4_MESPL|nr:conserved hypothetical protein [Mesorhizobium plurifarium]